MSTKAYDRALVRIRALCLALPEAREVEAWGHPTFRAGKKMFAGFGADAGTLSLGMKVGFARQDELLQDARFFPTPYAARQGWVSLRIGNKIEELRLCRMHRRFQRSATWVRNRSRRQPRKLIGVVWRVEL